MRLIDANDLISYMDECSKENRFRVYYGYARSFVDDAPTIDAVPAVRCRECKWWQEDDDVGHCDNPDGLDNYAKPEDFCSYGERKEGAER